MSIVPSLNDYLIRPTCESHLGLHHHKEVIMRIPSRALVILGILRNGRSFDERRSRGEWWEATPSKKKLAAKSAGG